MGNQLQITTQNKLDMLTTSRWGKFLAILGYLMIGLMLIAGILYNYRWCFFWKINGRNEYIAFSILDIWLILFNHSSFIFLSSS